MRATVLVPVPLYNKEDYKVFINLPHCMDVFAGRRSIDIDLRSTVLVSVPLYNKENYKVFY